MMGRRLTWHRSRWGRGKEWGKAGNAYTFILRNIPAEKLIRKLLFGISNLRTTFRTI
jgi:hypothetical protein